MTINGGLGNLQSGLSHDPQPPKGEVMNPITLWNRYDKESDSFQFNHLEDGHSDRDVPYAKFPEQKGWVNSKWTREHAYLDGENRVVKP